MLITASNWFSRSSGRWRMSAWWKVRPPLPSAFPPSTGEIEATWALDRAMASISSLRSTPVTESPVLASAMLWRPCPQHRSRTL